MVAIPLGANHVANRKDKRVTAIVPVNAMTASMIAATSVSIAMTVDPVNATSVHRATSVEIAGCAMIALRAVTTVLRDATIVHPGGKTVLRDATIEQHEATNVHHVGMIVHPDATIAPVIDVTIVPTHDKAAAIVQRRVHGPKPIADGQNRVDHAPALVAPLAPADALTSRLGTTGQRSARLMR